MKRSVHHGVLAAAAAAAAAAVLCVAFGGCGDSSPASAGEGEQQALARYRSFLAEHASAFTAAVEELLGPIRTHKVPRSESLYVISRVPFGAIEPVAASFSDLDLRITAQFRRIERGLWLEETTDGLKPFARGLRASSEALRRMIGPVPPRPKQIVTDIERSLRQISTVKIVGRGQPYADADLVDVAANIEGAAAAFVALKPLLVEEGQGLGRIEGRFRRLFVTLKQYGMLAREPRQYRPKAAGAIFSKYSELSQAEVDALAGEIEALDAQLSDGLAPVVRSQSSQ